MSLTGLEGRTYGPSPWRIAVDPVADFVDLTGDDPQRWRDHAPPGFAAAALFSVAPDLLAELYDRSVVHGEQTFTWHRPIEIGSELTVTGVVSRVRERAGVFFVSFDVEAFDDAGPVLDGRALFLTSGESAAVGDSGGERTEPTQSDRGGTDEGAVSASRADLIRYASATRDWNPVHWDHDAGVAAGFPGVVVHGLLQAGWALRAASADTVSVKPFLKTRVRFRNPLFPAQPASVDTRRGDGVVEVVVADANSEFLNATVELSDE